MKVQLVTSYRVSHLQRYGVTVRDNVTSMDPPLEAILTMDAVCFPENLVPTYQTVRCILCYPPCKIVTILTCVTLALWFCLSFWLMSKGRD